MTFAEGAARLAMLAARTLGWRPHDFWSATPAELALSLGVDEHAAPPGRAELAAMIARDNSERKSDG